MQFRHSACFLSSFWISFAFSLVQHCDSQTSHDVKIIEEQATEKVKDFSCERVVDLNTDSDYNPGWNSSYITSLQACVVLSDINFQLCAGQTPVIYLSVRENSTLEMRSRVTRYMFWVKLSPSDFASKKKCLVWDTCQISEKLQQRNSNPATVKLSASVLFKGLTLKAETAVQITLNSVSYFADTTKEMPIAVIGNHKLYQVVCMLQYCEVVPEDPSSKLRVIPNRFAIGAPNSAPTCIRDDKLRNSASFSIFTIVCKEDCPKDYITTRELFSKRCVALALTLS